jgi:two-component system sensor histidine kinase/response regulator
MNIEQTYFQHALKSGEKKLDGVGMNSKSADLMIDIGDIDNLSVNQLKERLIEMVELNIHSEFLLNERNVELNELIQTNSKFISIIAHDLRSPLSLILGNLDLLRNKLDFNKIIDVEKYLNNATVSANRTLNLLDNLLEWAILQNKVKGLNPVKVNLFEQISTEIENVNIAAQEKQIKISYFVDSDLNVSADLQMVKTILRNLISNAIKFTNSGGEIILRATEINQFVEIVIKDSGVGFTNNAQQKLFHIDELHSTMGTNHEKGTGLGLILCKEFIEKHNGVLCIESEPGNGSTLKFTLPHYI